MPACQTPDRLSSATLQQREASLAPLSREVCLCHSREPLILRNAGPGAGLQLPGGTEPALGEGGVLLLSSGAKSRPPKSRGGRPKGVARPDPQRAECGVRSSSLL